MAGAQIDDIIATWPTIGLLVPMSGMGLTVLEVD
jgi:hypothetical protein